MYVAMHIMCVDYNNSLFLLELLATCVNIVNIPITYKLKPVIRSS